MENLNAESLWNIIKNADERNHIMSIGTGGGDDTKGCAYNIPCGHAYTLYGAEQVTLKDGTEYKLYKIRNPWRSERMGSKTFSGKFNDGSDIWSQEPQVAKQLQFINSNDGNIWMTDYELLETFAAARVARWQKDW